MTRQFLKKTLATVFLTVLIVTTASLAYKYITPVILSDDISGMTDPVKDILSSTRHIGADSTAADISSRVSAAPNAVADIIPFATALGGKVTKIIDGDTLDIDGTRIRLALVNTPERGDLGYKEAAAFTQKHCPVGSTAMYDADDGQKDGSYGRVIGKVWCFGYPVKTPEMSLNAMLIDAGHAEVLSRFCKVSEFGSDNWAKPHC